MNIMFTLFVEHQDLQTGTVKLHKEKKGVSLKHVWAVKMLQ